MSRTAHDLRRLVREGGDANRLVLETARGYLVVHGERGAETLAVEVSAGRQLPDDARLSPEAHQTLHDAGFRRRSAADNYLREGVPVDAAEAEVPRILELLDPGGASTRALHLGHREPTENPTLLRAMERLSRVRDMQARRQVYMALLYADLLLALDAPPNEDAELSLHRAGTLGKGEVVAAFTDWESLRRYEPRGLHYAVLSGMELFPRLAERRVASLLINPRGHVGGELYRNEILSISDGAARLNRRG